MIIATVVALLVLPLVVLRGRTLLHCYATQLTLAMFASLLFPKFLPGAMLEFVVFAWFLARGSNVRWSANHAALIAAIVYALVISATSWKVDGDEPFYLLITDSIVRDVDLDLANQYRDGNIVPGRSDIREPQPGDPEGPRGEKYSRHEPFLSLVMAPAYALGGYHGALAVIALFGVLLVRSTIRWMEDEGIADDTARAVFPFFAFGPPVLFYATRIWPEVPAAFFFVEAIRGVRAQRAKRWIPALIGLVLLKVRFGLVAIGLILTGLRARRSRVIAIAIVAIPLAVMFAASIHSWRELIPAHPIDYARGLFGLLADGMSGIAFQAPFYLFGLAALLRWKQMPRGFRLGILASSLYIFYLLPRQESFANYGPPLRYLVFLMPVLALGAAAMWERIPRGAIAIAAAWTVGVVLHGVAYPWRLFHEANGENAVGEWLSSMYHADFSRLFPSFIRMNAAAWVGAVVVVVILFWLSSRASSEGAGRVGREDRAWRPARAGPSLDARDDSMVHIAIFAFVLAVGFRYGREPGSVIHFEDAHVIRDGGHLEPPPGTVNRGMLPGGWVLQEGQSLTFLARAGTHDLHAITGLGATIELGGHAYRVEPSLAHRTIRVTIPTDGPTTLRCVSGAVNLDRMELRDE